MSYEQLISAKKENGITVIGAAIIDIMAGPVDPVVFKTGSQPMDTIQMTFGGDALNEAIVLSRLGKKVELITKIGQDDGGKRVLDYLKVHNLSVDSVVVEEGMDTGINIVLFDESGERYFLTNPYGSLRKLSEKDIEPFLEGASEIVSFASMFVSPLLDIPAMERLFQKIKSKPSRILTVDLTKAKNGEKLEDLRDVLPWIDFFFTNEEEIAFLTAEEDPAKNAESLLDAGVFCVIIKLGEDGCLISTRDEKYQIPAYKIEKVVDTTGAGDTFVAGFLWALSEGYPLKECGRFACAAASCSVEEIGSAADKISLEKIIERFRKWK